jgi:mitotic spindle assembly checkpoint protein MAD1
LNLIHFRLKHTENLERQVFQLEINQAELLSKISEYEEIGISGGPITIRREINRLQHAEALLTAEEGQLRSRVESIQRELITYQQQYEDTKKQLTETTTSHERLTRFISRLQKKMSLVTRERDSYRQQLDTYEKEITGYQSGEVPNVINERIPALERAIESYR